MKRKKLMSVLLVSALAVGMVSGCGNDKKEELAESSENSKPYEGVELSMLVDNATGKEGYEAVLDLAEKEFGIKVKVEEGLRQAKLRILFIIIRGLYFLLSIQNNILLICQIRKFPHPWTMDSFRRQV